MIQADLFSGRSILVIGDVMLDRYVRGSVDRISPEAPVPVLKLTGDSCSPGGAGHVAASLAALGVNVSLFGVVGDDLEGQTLLQQIESHDRIATNLTISRHNCTICKTRIVAGSYQQLVRLDCDGDPNQFGKEGELLLERVLSLIPYHDVVVVSDYDKGLLTETALATVINTARANGVVCIVDPKKKTFSAYRGADVLTPNLFEAETAVGSTLRTKHDLEMVASQLRSNYDVSYLVLTRGPDGITLATRDSVQHLAAHTHEVADVSGAGDTVVAALAAGLSIGWDIIDAVELANLAAGIAVSHPGTYAVSIEEILHGWDGVSPKIVTSEVARRRIMQQQSIGRRVVFTNGCFDVLHAGHLSCLERARRLGDMLIVGLNSDLSVRINKGTERPIIPQKQRAALLAGLSCVDMVVLFDDPTPEQLVRELAPDVLVKGDDYRGREIAGADFVRGRGGQVILLPIVYEVSSTSILQQLRAAAAG